MSDPTATPEAPERVLPTLNQDGSRRWIRPKPERGRWFRRRRVTAYGLMLVFFLLPYLQLRGKPLILLDLPRREFTLFGATFLSTDTLPFALLFMSLLVGIFLITALLGRVWCGWACPQTVYMEFLFRPLERWLEGGYRGSQLIDEQRRLNWRRWAKYAVYAVLAMFLAHTFLAYFVGVRELAKWVTRSPVEHPTSFFVMLGTSALIFFDFAYFREQTCLVACPYGRLQSVLLDRQSLIVGYDAWRGEPRMKGIRDREPGAGDCIDCHRCVATCPTGIDIRDGLQMECIHCTQCADACDAVMTKIGKPVGLIRYTSREAVEGRPVRILRPRVLIYPVVLTATLGLFGWTLAHTADTEVTVLRAVGAPFTREADGSVINQVVIKIANRGDGERSYAVQLDGLPGGKLIAPVNPMVVGAGKALAAPVFVVLPAHLADSGEFPVTFTIREGGRRIGSYPYRLVGPEKEEGARHEAGEAESHETEGAGRPGGRH